MIVSTFVNRMIDKNEYIKRQNKCVELSSGFRYFLSECSVIFNLTFLDLNRTTE